MNDTAVTNSSDLALFLDIDGTLLELAPTPNAVEVPPPLPKLLSSLAERLDGALALVSGRELHEIDRLFAPYQFYGAGAHGCELRMPSIDAVLPMANRQLVAIIHDECRALVPLHSDFDRLGFAQHWEVL
jgi:trehalose 6-phosphate phosphatase